MTEPIYKGTVSFVNYEKNFATIEYEQGTKKKSVNCKTDALINGRKPHYFRVGDEVNFMLKLSDRGDKMTGYNVKYLYNTALDVMIQKAAIENRFSGYLKKVEDSYFVKEWDSYIFFPLIISPWEKPPAETAANEAISFRLINLDKLNSMAAELFSHNYIPEYKKAVQHFNNRIIIEAEIYKITPHAFFLNLFGDKVQARLATSATGKEKMKEGDIVPVLISHLTHTRIVVDRADRKD